MSVCHTLLALLGLTKPIQLTRSAYKLHFIYILVLDPPMNLMFVPLNSTELQLTWEVSIKHSGTIGALSNALAVYMEILIWFAI